MIWFFTEGTRKDVLPARDYGEDGDDDVCDDDDDAFVALQRHILSIFHFVSIIQTLVSVGSGSLTFHCRPIVS